MVEVNVEYLGQLRCKAVHRPSGQVLLTDAPTDNKGRGEYFSPTDLVATGLASCMLTIMGIAAQKYNIDLSGAMAKVIKQMTALPPRRIESLTVTITVPSPLNDEQKKILEQAAMNCPVHVTLGNNVNIPVQFTWAGA